MIDCKSVCGQHRRGLESAGKANDKILSHFLARLPLICAGFTSRLGGGFSIMEAIKEGTRFGRLTIHKCLGRAGVRNELQYDATCDCGSESKPFHSNLISGRTASCGCTHRKHGMTDTPTFKSWLSMRGRCNNPNDPTFALYGGRGITVCERWNDQVNGFSNFLADLGERPSLKYSIERINTDGNYEPGNCRWATQSEQANNKRTNHTLTFAGKTQNITQWSKETGIPRITISKRIDAGWAVERALSEAVHGEFRNKKL
jgi:hypothetical protein